MDQHTEKTVNDCEWLNFRWVPIFMDFEDGQSTNFSTKVLAIFNKNYEGNWYGNDI